MDNVEIQMYNSVGKFVQDIYSGNTLTNQTIMLNATNLSSGVYIISYKEKDFIIKKPFTISK